jgi:hypothetical protein
MGSSKIFVEVNNNILEFLTKYHPGPVRRLGEKLKSSYTRKFGANPEIVLQTLTI